MKPDIAALKVAHAENPLGYTQVARLLEYAEELEQGLAESEAAIRAVLGWNFFGPTTMPDSLTYQCSEAVRPQPCGGGDSCGGCEWLRKRTALEEGK